MMANSKVTAGHKRFAEAVMDDILSVDYERNLMHPRLFGRTSTIHTPSRYT